jgi:hypothetical protein
MNKQHPDSANLLVFMAVARHSSFVAAPDELGVSTAFVTKRIKVVEALLETKLFNLQTAVGRVRVACQGGGKAQGSSGLMPARRSNAASPCPSGSIGPVAH